MIIFSYINYIDSILLYISILHIFLTLYLKFYICNIRSNVFTEEKAMCFIKKSRKNIMNQKPRLKRQYLHIMLFFIKNKCFSRQNIVPFIRIID